MRLVFAGTPAVAATHLSALLQSGHDVVAVITRPPAPAGRGRSSRPSPVAEVAEAAGIDILTHDWQQSLARYAPECCPVVAFGHLIPQSLLDQPRFGWVNVHFSLLPRWRGAAPVQWAIQSGDTETGVTIFRIDAGLDTGPVLAVGKEAIRSDDTSGALLDRLAVTGSRLLIEVMDGLEAGIVEPYPQDSAGITIAPKLTPENARIPWDTSAVEIDRLIRACTPNPGAWTQLGDTRVRIGPVRVSERDAPPGHVVMEGNDLRVGTASGSVHLQTLQPQGKRMMPAADWWRGLRSSTPVHFT